MFANFEHMHLNMFISKNLRYQFSLILCNLVIIQYNIEDSRDNMPKVQISNFVK